jgi:hypothetical protein
VSLEMDAQWSVVVVPSGRELADRRAFEARIRFVWGTRTDMR